MIQTTKGIVIHQFKYAEKSVIAKIYTEKYGLQSYILNNVRGKKTKNKAVYLQPLSLVELNFFHKENGGLQKVRSINLDVPFHSIPFNISKTSIAFFVAEIIYKSIKEEEVNEKLFAFLKNAIQVLDLAEKNYRDFHLLFLAQFTKYLGFYPQTGETSENLNLYFDLQEGYFVYSRPPHKAILEDPISTLFQQVFGTGFDKMERLIIRAKQRKQILHSLMEYYNIHLSNFDNLKTIEVLEEILE